MIRAIVLLCLTAVPALADEPEIVEATARPSGETWSVAVTLGHPDTGWDHYADGWRVVTAEGDVVGLRELLHPHETEQPFTRSLSGVTLPDGPLFIEARCNVDGWGKARLPLSRD